MRRAAGAAGALALAALLATALAACETTQEKSARLEKAALKKQAGAPLGATGLKITKPGRTVEVLSAVALGSREGSAVAVKVRNRSGRGQEQVPVLIDVTGAGGSAVYSNSTAGLSNSLVAVKYLPPHGTVVWVDDQISSTTPARAVAAKVGDGKATGAAAPKVAVVSSHLEHEPGGPPFVEGTVANRSKVDQRELVVTALAERGSRTLAAGRAVLASLPAGASSRFQIFMIGGDPAGAKLVLGVTPSTLG